MPLSPDWVNLPKRKCDNCGTPYKPTRPLRPGVDKFGFCQPSCKKEFHKNGGAFRKLKVMMEKFVRQELKSCLREIVREEIARHAFDPGPCDLRR
jgi:hypothetical protein